MRIRNSSMIEDKPQESCRHQWSAAVALLLTTFPFSAPAQTASVCARVSVRIAQEATMTRKGFSAGLTVNNAAGNPESVEALGHAWTGPILGAGPSGVGTVGQN